MLIKHQKTLKIVSVLLTLCIVMSLCVFNQRVNVYADTPITDDGFEYEIVDDTVTIIKYLKDETNVVVPEMIEGKPVTKIASYAFFTPNGSHVETVKLPETIISIGDYAFYLCHKFTEINCPNSVISIGEGAFQDTNLSTIDLSDSITNIERFTFAGCSNLTKIVIPKEVKQIGSQAFAGCFNLSEITLPDGLTTIDGSAFDGCGSLKSITIPDSVTSLDNYLFSGCSSLENIIIPKTVTFIGFGAFCNCYSLKSISLPDNITTIGKDTFKNCNSLESITIPDGVTTIGDDAFYGCTNLREVEIPNSVTTILGAFRKCSSELTFICAPNSCASSFAEASGIKWVSNTYDNPFTDIEEGKNYYDAVIWAYYSNPQIVSGITDTLFKPFNNCNRAQVVSFLWRMKGCPEPGTVSEPFDDVKESDFFYKPVLWALENNITSGKSAKKFGAFDVCTRAQFVTFLWRCAGEQKPVTTENPFSDIYEKDFYKDAVLWAYENNITSGKDATHFNPKGIINRAQAVMFLHRFSKLTTEEVDEDFCVVSFDTQVEGYTIDDQKVKTGSHVSMPVVQPRDGFSFDGWFKDPECSNPFSFDDETITENITLYAGWSEITEENTDEAIVDEVIDSLTIGYSDGDYADSVICDLNLPVDFEGVTVRWESSDPDVVSGAGEVTRCDDDKKVSIHAIVSRNEVEKVSADFEVTVKHISNIDKDDIQKNTVDIIKDMNKDKDIDFFIRYNDDKSQVTSINGKFSDIKIETSEDAIMALYSVKDILGINDPEKELKVVVVNHTKYGNSYTFRQVYDDVDFYGRFVTVVSNINGETTSLSSNFFASVKCDTVKTEPVISDKQACQYAKELYQGREVDASVAESMIYSFDEYKNEPPIAYIINVTNKDEGSLISDTVIINASDGTIINKNSNLENLFDVDLYGDGVDESGNNQTFPVKYNAFWDTYPILDAYSLYDMNRKIAVYSGGRANNTSVESAGKQMTNSNNEWNDPTAISAYTNCIKVFDWYKDGILKRNSIDDKGMKIVLSVHMSGRQNNASWDGNGIVFFDNSSQYSTYPTPANSLDAIAHEYTHGVIKFMTPAIKERGTKNGHFTNMVDEAYADIFGWFVDFDDTSIADDYNPIDYSLVTPQNVTPYKRDIANPGNDGHPSRIPSKSGGDNNWLSWNECKNNKNDDNPRSTFAHRNSTVISHAAYLMYNGFPSEGLPGLSYDTLVHLWYESLKSGYVTEDGEEISGEDYKFSTVRDSVIKAADSIPLTFKEKLTIKKAFDEVGILSETDRNDELAKAYADLIKLYDNYNNAINNPNDGTNIQELTDNNLDKMHRIDYCGILYYPHSYNKFKVMDFNEDGIDDLLVSVTVSFNRGEDKIENGEWGLIITYKDGEYQLLGESNMMHMICYNGGWIYNEYLYTDYEFYCYTSLIPDSSGRFITYCKRKDKSNLNKIKTDYYLFYNDGEYPINYNDLVIDKTLTQDEYISMINIARSRSIVGKDDSFSINQDAVDCLENGSIPIHSGFNSP